MLFKKIGLAVAFSPRIKALLAEAARLKNLFGSELVLIHVGPHGPAEDEKLHDLLQQSGMPIDEVKIIWENGKPSDRILAACEKENIDLLVAGALKKENLMQYYAGSVARKILRKAECSVLMLINPSDTPRRFTNLVVTAENSPFVEETIETACHIGVLEKASWLHIVRELKLYGLTMAMTEQYSEKAYEDFREKLVKDEVEKVEKMLSHIPHEGLKVNVKLVSGKSGFELVQFAQRKHADLLIAGAPPRRFSFFDRIFPHDLEYIFADMPCNLLIVHPRRNEKGGARA